MFEVNDKFLRTARVILNIWVWGGAIVCVIGGIVLSAVGMLAAGLPILFAGPFVCWVSWVFGRMHLSHLCDVKLIRNKLYGIGNEDLDVFLKTKAERTAPVYPQDAGTPSATGNSDYAGQEAYKPVARAEQALREEKTAAPLSMEERTQKLLRLKKLLDAGTITKEEFDREKAKLLNN